MSIHLFGELRFLNTLTHSQLGRGSQFGSDSNQDITKHRKRENRTHNYDQRKLGKTLSVFRCFFLLCSGKSKSTSVSTSKRPMTTTTAHSTVKNRAAQHSTQIHSFSLSLSFFRSFDGTLYSIYFKLETSSLRFEKKEKKKNRNKN